MAAGGKREKVSYVYLLQFTPLLQWIVILIENMNIKNFWLYFIVVVKCTCSIRVMGLLEPIPSRQLGSPLQDFHHHHSTLISLETFKIKMVNKLETFLHKTATENKYIDTWIHKNADVTYFTYFLLVLIQYIYNIFAKCNKTANHLKMKFWLKKMADVATRTLS